MKSLLWSLFVLHVGAKQQNPNAVSRVVELLNGLAEKVEFDMKKQEDLYEDYVCWGKSIISSKTETNKKAETRVDHLESYIEDLEAGRVELTSERVDLEKEVAGLLSDIEKSKALRKKEKEDFAGAKDELEKGIKALDDAAEVLKEATKDHKDGSLLALRGKLNGGFAERAAEADALTHAVNVGRQFLSRGDAFFLQRILEGDISNPDSQKKLNRKATFKMSYKARSFKIQGVLKKLLSSFKDSLKGADDKEQKAEKEHNKLMKSKESLLEKAQNSLTTMNGEGGAVGLSKQDSKDEVADLKEQIKNDKTFMEETHSALEDKKDEWKQRKVLMVGEIAAINKAISILHSDDARDLFKRSFESHGASFVQIRLSHRGRQQHVLKAAQTSIVDAARNAGDVRLIALSMQLSAEGHFDKVLVKIDKMIKQLEKESDEDSKVKEACESDRRDNIKVAKETSHSIDELSDEIEKLEKEIKDHKEEIEENKEEVQKIRKDLKKATKMREEENAAWKKSDADDKAASELVASATEVLSKYYKENGLNFLQVSNELPTVEAGEAPPPPPKTWEEPYGGAKETKGIVSILKTIKEDIDKDCEDAEKAEDTAKTKFEEMKTESEKQVTILEDANTDLDKTVGEKVDKITDSKTETATKKKELETTIKKLKDAQKGCDFITVNFELREENRKIEIDGLTKAKEILAKEN